MLHSSNPIKRNALKFSTFPSSSTSFLWTQRKAEAEQDYDLDQFLCNPNTVSLSHHLQWCGRSKDLQHGRYAHSFIITHSFDAISVLHVSLVQMYGNCASMDDALKVFFDCRTKDLDIWNAFLEILARQRAFEEMLKGYNWMRQECIVPDRSTFMHLLSLSFDHLTLAECKQIHVFIIEIGCKEDVVVGTSLLNMYGRGGSFEEAKKAFQTMPSRNLVTWTTMISICARYSQGKESMSVFESMLREGIEPDEVTFINLLASCSSQSMILQGQRIHDLVIQQGFEKDVRIVNALINLYGKCGNVKNAQKVFDSVQIKDVISWTSLVTIYAEHGEHVEVLGLFDRMQKEGQSPNKVTFISVLAMFDCNEALPTGRYIHNYIITKGLDGDIIIANSLFNMYNKCSTVEEAKQIFHQMMNRNVISWTLMIGIHAEEGHVNDALEAFLCMQEDGIVPNKVTFINMVEACASQAAFREGKCMHKCIICMRIELDVSIETALLKMYGICGSFMDAWDVFDRMVDRDVLSWNTIVALYVNHGHGNMALHLFQLMQGQGVLPNEATYGFLLVACTGITSVSDGIEIHAQIQGTGEIEPNVVSNTNLLNMYSKCGCLEKSRTLFDKMVEKNIFSWTAMIAAYGENGDSKSAFRLCAQMLQESLLPNEVTWISLIMACNDQVVDGKRIHACILHGGFNAKIALGNAIINMYSKWGDIDHAQQTFDGMCEKNVVSWSGMISLYAQNSQGNVAMQLFEQMQEKGISPNEITLVTLLSMCVNQTYLTEGQRMHTFILENKLASSTLLGNCLVNMYGKCGNILGAWEIFWNMVEKDKMTWNVMIGACAEHGQGREALALVKQMMKENTLPDEDTFVNLLSACSHSGQVTDGWECFVFLKEYYCANSDHYACVIDLFGRAGLLKEAENMMYHCPVQPTIMSFMSMLSSCRSQGDVIRGECAAKHVLELNIKSTAPFYMLKCIYSIADEYESSAMP